MKLSLEQIKSVAKGVARVVSEEGKIRLLRFTEEQEKLYAECTNGNFHIKVFATAGVRLEFITNSKYLFLKTDVSRVSSKTNFSHDIYVNGKRRLAIASDLSYVADKHMTIEGSCSLGDKDKRVCIYFPWSVRSEIISLELDDGATLIPIEHSKSILMFGDSITHGYCSEDSSRTYANLVTDALDAQGCNKGIGGEIFRPELASLPESYTPDIITVAYGTNDWSRCSKEEFDEGCEGFYTALSGLYPTAKIFALAPVWRGDLDSPGRVGPFEYVRDKLFSVASALPNVTFIDCFDFVPHSRKMYMSDLLHPCEAGFAEYAARLSAAIKSHIE